MDEHIRQRTVPAAPKGAHSYSHRPNVTERVSAPNSIEQDLEDGAAFEEGDDVDALQALIKQNQQLDADAKRTKGNAEFPTIERQSSLNPRRQVKPPVDEFPETGMPDDVDEDGTPIVTIDRNRKSKLANVADGPSKPPPITPMQARVAKLLRGEDEDKVSEVEKPKSGAKPRFILKRANVRPEYIRINLLSDFIFYDWKDVQARRINLDDQSKIYLAQQTNDVSALIDALGGTIADDIDIRDFTVPDFFYFCYWHRLRSYTTTPFLVNWTSKYGNENSYRITESTLKYNPPKLSEDDYKAWQGLGFAVPTVRDMEFFINEDLTAHERWVFEKAQYMYAKKNDNGEIDVQDKIDALIELCGEAIDNLSQLEDFKKDIDHSIVEEVQLTDEKFDGKVYAATLKAKIEQLEREAEIMLSVNPVRYMSLKVEVEELQDSYDVITDQLEKGGEVLPDVENVQLKLMPLDFFPYIF